MNTLSTMGFNILPRHCFDIVVSRKKINVRVLKENCVVFGEETVKDKTISYCFFVCFLMWQTLPPLQLQTVFWGPYLPLSI